MKQDINIYTLRSLTFICTLSLVYVSHPTSDEIHLFHAVTPVKCSIYLYQRKQEIHQYFCVLFFQNICNGSSFWSTGAAQSYNPLHYNCPLNQVPGITLLIERNVQNLTCTVCAHSMWHMIFLTVWMKNKL